MAGMNVMNFSTPHAQGVTPTLSYDILFPVSMSRLSDNVEQDFQTEDGHTQAIVTRQDKQSISMSFSCSSAWVKKFKQFYLMDYFFFTEYNPITEANEVRNVRMRNFTEEFVKNSHVVDSTVSQGLWNVSFTLEEL